MSTNGIDVLVERKPVTRVNLRVRRDGSVVVSAPPRVPLRQIEDFVRDRQEWIEDARGRILASHERRAASLREGGTVTLFGSPLELHVVRDAGDARPWAEQTREALLVHVPKSTDGTSPSQAVDEAILRWQRQALERVLPDLFARFEREVGVRSSGWRLRRMTSRWGSCNVRTGRISINTELARLPLECLESVVVHELCHLLDPHHDARFHALMDAHYPAWREARAILNANPPLR